MNTELAENIIQPWDRREDEPEVWYNIFKEYYLPLGEQRSLRNAFEFYIRVEQPKEYAQTDPDNITRIPQHWNTMAFEWEWAARALSYDAVQMPSFTQMQVSQALEHIRANSMKAARALVQALSNERTRVQAANALLNRAGIPEVSQIDFTTQVFISADDMAEASKKVAEWKTKKLNG